MGTEQILFGASIIVAFLSGIIALFAPCCITFLLPSYLGQILRARAKILLGTLLFGLGIATVMLPVALGFRVIVTLFQEFHTVIYVIGGLMMVFFGVWTFLDKKINLRFVRSPKFSDKIEFSSLYGMGVFGGLTSVCCAPVLFGALILAGLSATFIKTIAVGFAYTAGIVFPLFLGALLWESNPLLPARSFLAKSATLKFFAIRKEFSLGNLVAGLSFIIFGIAFAILALLNKIAMPSGTGRAGVIIGFAVLKVGSFIKNYPYLEYVFLILLIILTVFLIKRARTRQK